MKTTVNKNQTLDYIDDKVYNINEISEIGKSSDKENMKNDFLKTEKQNENYNSKSVHDEVQLGSRNFYKNNKNGSELVNTSSSTKTYLTENHSGIQKKSLDFHSNASRMPDQVKCGVI